ncbi:EF-hand domain-containing protein [Pseudomonas sp. S2_H01]|jgi:Ca2+-binding EF-hand superfamily protein
MAILTSDQLERAKKAFSSWDTNGDKTLTVEEFSAALKPYLTDETLAKLLKAVNPNGDNVISWEEFLKDYESDL